MPACLIALGSNQGNRQETLDAAIGLLAEHPQIKILAKSAWRETSPIGGPAGQLPFLNGAAKLETLLGPHDLLRLLQQIENQLGRRREERWGPRTIDLDLLLYDEWTANEPSLVLPHPRMAWRRFVLEPAAEIAGSMRHPTIGWSVEQLLEHLNTAAPYLAVTGPIAAGKTQLARRLATSLSWRLIVERPDWKRLEVFYADTAAHAWEMELEFLEHRAELLAEKSLTASWTVSDFWFDQSAAFARSWLPSERWEEYERRYGEYHRTMPRPKLIVLLDAPAEELYSRVRRRGRECERPVAKESLERIRQEIRKQTALPDVGPVLCIDGGDSESAYAETLAAVQGME
jgi:2-amino-4-hydroxy-6-hydroxymethyldihydropteridine diphosphokinase